MKSSRNIHPNIPRHVTIAFHLLALAIVTVWGTTFVSTKILLKSGFGPADIMLYRFILAYAGICLCSRPFKLLADTRKDELLCLLAGLFGGTLYFITENTALEYTLISNVSLLCSTAPLLIILIQCFITKSVKPNRFYFVGSIMALAGVATVIFNGQFILDLNPIGDLLCIVSAFSWTLYTFITKSLSERYSALFIVRKTFFYGIVTLIPWLLWKGTFYFDVQTLCAPRIWSQLLFLGIVASFLCFMLWNICLRKINTIVLSNYIYLVPVVSITTSTLILNESINAAIITGAALVIMGMYLAGKTNSK